jgi:hypothetical protein
MAGFLQHGGISGAPPPAGTVSGLAPVEIGRGQMPVRPYMNFKSVVMLLAAALCFSIITNTASSQVRSGPPSSVPKMRPGHDLDYFVSITGFTDNRSQGFSSTRSRPGVSADFGLIWNRFYTGVTVENADIGDNAAGRNLATVKASLSLGYVWTWGDFNLDLNGSYVTFPGANEDGPEINYFEYSAGVARKLLGDLTAGFRVYFSPENSGKTGVNWIFEGSLEKPLTGLKTELGGTMVTPLTHSGHYPAVKNWIPRRFERPSIATMPSR